MSSLPLFLLFIPLLCSLFGNYAKREFLPNKHAKINTILQTFNLSKKTIKKPTKKPHKIPLIKENKTSGNQQKNHKKNHKIKIIHKFLSLIFNHLQK